MTWHDEFEYRDVDQAASELNSLCRGIRMRFNCNASVLIVICAASAFGQVQVSGSIGSSANGPSGTARFAAAMPFSMRNVVSGAPYAGEEVNEQIQTLADGTHITRKQAPSKIYRDSLGRTRTERPIMRGMTFDGRATDSPIVVEITDPVAQLKYTFLLDRGDHVAHRQRVASPQQRPARPELSTPYVRSGVMGGTVSSTGGTTVASSTGRIGQGVMLPAQSAESRPQISDEKLGTQTIEGVLAEGTRHTTTWPVNSQGNDRPISAVSELWTSPELKVTILSKSNDPRSGESVQKLINISRAEPSASLFQPPPDYTVVDEEGDFTVKWGKP